MISSMMLYSWIYLSGLVFGLVQAKVYLQASFDQPDALNAWYLSKARQDFGEWRLTSGLFYADIHNLGLQTTQDHRYYAACVPLNDEGFDNRDKTLVLQFSVKFEQHIDCGGGYVKLLPKEIDPNQFDSHTRYHLMFGPDICGTDRRVKLVLYYKDKPWQISSHVIAPADQLTHLYRLVIRPDQTFEIYVDQREEAYGNLLEEYSALPENTIEDMQAVKPSDWVDEATIIDETDVKPPGYDDIPKFIPIGPLKPPRWWNATEDGEWTPVVVMNPEYRGPWQPRRIPNPAYRGPWQRPRIPHPDYRPDKYMYAFHTAYLGIDIWQAKAGTIFDDILITDDEDYADQYAEETYVKRKQAELEAKRRLDQEEEEALLAQWATL